MKLRLVAHASLLIEAGGATIWTDPWLGGKVFNNSWSLLVPPSWDAAWLEQVDHLWVSHEHPDHFHLPTLRDLPAAFKRRVTVLFQQLPTDKLPQAFARLGYDKVRLLPHRALVDLRPGLQVYCYQVGQMDSVLAVMSEGTCLVNVNDAEADAGDCRIIRGDLGPAQVVLNQFSLAGYGGEADREQRLPRKARAIVDSMIANHRDLGAETTIPIASFVRFSCEDNAYMNAYANTPRRVAEAFEHLGLRLDALAPGDAYTVGGAWDSSPALAFWDRAFADAAAAPLDRPAPVELAALVTAAEALAARLAEHYPTWLLHAWLEPVAIRVRDLDVTLRLDLARGRCEPAPGAPVDVEVCGQPLLFALSQPFGLQTLGVSARLIVRRGLKNWRRHRILLSMYNAEVYLRPRELLTRRNLGHLRARLRGGLRQLRYQLQRMR
ncbi:MBL fold metallo-hydrolase [Nannocystis sp. SCPEA4]|uniref:MBL fold metallo-hydrolase n=1 Tax=Nannocystis sp. SCPEA4 TaxID=2996787 RepID=UPI00226EEA70|nr:MBL fold metallo-hydrolase [Nannocystis sp. SCPEA4]MCY1056372.1 MBL fold metallo-hydrolase [Nannocystis sp. SCPEA4]